MKVYTGMDATQSERMNSERCRRKVKTATPSSIRDINRALILNLLRLHEPVSRAGLSALTGIHRSNVSAIVEQLIGERLVVEKRATPRGPGRAPYMLSLNDAYHSFLGISIRPLETTLVVSGLSGRIRKRLSISTPQNPTQLLQWIIRSVRLLQNKAGDGCHQSFRRVGVSVPGFANSANGRLVRLPALREYSGFPLRAEIEHRTGVPTAIDNDCNLGALAELWLAEKEVAGIKDFVFLEVGDAGVGAGLILKGEIYRGHDSAFAGEFGHMVIDDTGPKCSCSRRGCWERYVCDRAIWHRYRPHVKFDAAGFDHLIQEARSGESCAVATFKKAAHYFSLGLANIAFSLNPEVIIVAGKITQVWDLILPICKKELAFPWISVAVRPARLKADELFLCGAVLLAAGEVFLKPRLG